MRRRAWVLVLGLLAGCADPGTGGPDGVKRYEVSATVLEDASHGPELCLGVLMASLPPQCGGPPLVGWNWADVSGEERVHETIWGRYKVIGTYDGTTFTLTEKPGDPEPYPDTSEPIRSACPEPPGGWPKPDPSKADDPSYSAATQHARTQPDLAAIWIVHEKPPSGGVTDYSTIVLNVGFTGDLEQHETDLRRYWGGALCLFERERTLAELEELKSDGYADAGELGLTVLMADADEVEGVVELTVITFTSEDQDTLDERYGEGLIRLIAVLEEVD